MRGQFRFTLPNGEEIIVPNIITDQGEEDLLKMILQADVAIVSAGGNWFVGLCEETPGETDTLASISTEPTSAGGYARQPIARNTTGWPTISQVNDAFRGLSLQITFAASGADFSRTIQRAFLTNVVSGTAGRLFAYSGLLPNPLLITDGNNLPVKYELFLR